jgi:predicted RNase H-like HicB family nuclease
MVVEKVIAVRVERLPEGCYLATSDDVQGLVAQGRTIEETLQIAKDVARKLLEAQENLLPQLPEAASIAEYPLVVGV